jgi:asparagine synthase (glutamine-hydrolysing)
MKGRLPPEILWRPKMGFSIPLARWFKGDLLDYAREILLQGESPYFRKAYLNRMFSNGWLEDPARALKGWTLLMFEQWRRQYRI